MEMKAYQDWLEAWDKARGWDRVSPSHTLIHAFEELGEVARLMLQWEGYKGAESAEKLHVERHHLPCQVVPTDLARGAAEAAAGVLDRSEGLAEQVVGRRAGGQPRAELRRLGLERRVVQRLVVRLDRVDAVDERP